MTKHGASAVCVRCLENSVYTLAKMNPHTGFVLCDSCTAVFNDANFTKGFGPFHTKVQGAVAAEFDKGQEVDSHPAKYDSESSNEYDAEFIAEGRKPLTEEEAEKLGPLHFGQPNLVRTNEEIQ